MTAYARIEWIATLTIGIILTVAIGLCFGYWGIVPAVLTAGVLQFYRDPPRQPPTDASLVLAAADGRIVAVSRNVVTDDGPMLRIMIFLSVFNVHVNRSPCAGKITDVQYRPGMFRSALRPDADADNESNTLTIMPAGPLPGPIRVRQIAGMLARRIVCRVGVGDAVAAGQRFGMIKLGSRTEISVPERDDWEVLVNVGASVRAGATPLLRLRAETPTQSAQGTS